MWIVSHTHPLLADWEDRRATFERLSACDAGHSVYWRMRARILSWLIDRYGHEVPEPPATTPPVFPPPPTVARLPEGPFRPPRRREAIVALLMEIRRA